MERTRQNKHVWIKELIKKTNCLLHPVNSKQLIISCRLDSIIFYIKI